MEKFQLWFVEFRERARKLGIYVEPLTAMEIAMLEREWIWQN